MSDRLPVREPIMSLSAEWRDGRWRYLTDRDKAEQAGERLMQMMAGGQYVCIGPGAEDLKRLHTFRAECERALLRPTEH